MGKRHHTWHVELCDTRWIMTKVHTRPSPRTSTVTALLTALATSACANSPTGLQGRWIGEVKPISGTCDLGSQAVLTIESGGKSPYSAIFAPTGGVLTLHGNSDGISRVDADLHATGANHQSYILVFTGNKAGNLILGTYITQRCRSVVELRRE